MLRTLWRLLLGSFALALAIPFGVFVMGAGILSDPILRGTLGQLGVAALKAGAWSLVSELSPETVVEAVTRVTKAVLMVVALPPLLAAAIGETLRLRSATWYWGTGAVLTAFLPWTARDGFRSPLDPAALPDAGRLTAILFVAGAASGFVYWVIAGRSAGRRAALASDPACGTPTTGPRLPAPQHDEHATPARLTSMSS